MRGEPELVRLKDRNGKLKSPYWYIQYYEGRSRRISTGYRIGAQDHEAQLALAAFILERERPTAREPDKLMVAQALKDYYEEHAQYLPSAEQAQYSEAKLIDFFGTLFVNQLTPSRINNYVRNWQEKKRSNGTIRRDLQHLIAALNHEVKEQRLIYAPRFKLPPPPAPRQRILSSDEINRLLAQCRADHLRNFVILMLDTGQRPGAIERLTWFQVDFENGIIHFDKDGRQQTNKRKKPVPMSDQVLKLLARLYKTRQTEYVLEIKRKKAKAVPAGCVRKAFERACSNAGLEDVSRYTLRHTFVNDLDEMGVDEKTMGELVGHTNPKTTRHHYIKAKMPRLRLAVNRLSKQRKNSASKKRGKKNAR